ncbi:hypothetical protein [Serratia fonticola]|uniref:Uncharacterized protein n=1 Tax=Serratia fonticola TaxID=47917 RepID=A0AAW3WP16_SERFO|nr:hypothetical protein [Serratia fonticola]MBC3211377.1 hypothetical protein [Serratia fonticola]NYA12359.1 hypothetical protein [Serratia fonticola]NYA31938.1 hypothetical protein [Serratia fonticola]
MTIHVKRYVLINSGLIGGVSSAALDPPTATDPPPTPVFVFALLTESGSPLFAESGNYLQVEHEG